MLLVDVLGLSFAERGKDRAQGKGEREGEGTGERVAEGKGRVFAA